MNLRLVGSGKSNTPLRKGNQHDQGAPHASSGGEPRGKNSSENDGDGFKATVTSGTVEFRFMTEPAKGSSSNLCIRLREFIKEAQMMDVSFRVMPLEGEGGDCINQPEDWPNNKEGIDRLYRHWNRPNNISGKMKIVTKLSLVELKLTSGKFVTYLRRRGVHMKYKELRVFDTLTLGWVAGAHPSFIYREDKRDIGETYDRRAQQSPVRIITKVIPFHY
jgi:hypothetical protein